MDFRNFIEETLRDSAEIALQMFGRVTAKTKEYDNNQVLTEADLTIGRHIITQITTHYPSHNILDEEAGAIENNSIFTWVVDPIEATSNFASGSTEYGIMLGLLEGDQPLAGGIIAPSRNEIFLAQRGLGAAKNSQPLTVTDENKLRQSLVSFSADGYPDNPERTHREFNLATQLALTCRNLRNNGCEAIDSMYVATGAYGGRINMTSKIWDNVAPQIIIEEAGGCYVLLNGQSLDYSRPLQRLDDNYTILATTPDLKPQLLAITIPFISNLNITA